MSKRKRYYNAKHFGGAGAGQSNVTTGWRWAKRQEPTEKEALPDGEPSGLDTSVSRFILALIFAGVLFIIFK